MYKLNNDKTKVIHVGIVCIFVIIIIIIITVFDLITALYA